MVNMHGAYKPTGLRRAYPNLLTREGVLGLEWSKWSEKCNPDHELILPFTRMLAGPMDFTPGAFTVANREKFEARITAPMAMGTVARQLAMYVVYESPLQMLVDHPAAYFGHPGMNFLREVPTSWDEIKFIDGKIGDYITLARKAGEEWYIGAMTDWTAREIHIPLEFLDQGPYMAHIYRDHEAAGDFPERLEIELMEVTQKNVLKIWLAAGGGCAIRLVPTWSVP
jgi:alpha-glucosidase